MGVLIKRAVVVTDNTTGAAKYGICGSPEEVERWLASPTFDRSTHTVTDVPPDEYVTTFSPDLHRITKQADGKFHKRAKHYDELRGAEYPQLHQQLDALWHAMDAGEIPKAKQFYNDIKKVKDKYPKP